MRFLEMPLFFGDFMSLMYCYSCQPVLVRLHVISDSLIALAYPCVPVTSFHFIGSNPAQLRRVTGSRRPTGRDQRSGITTNTLQKGRTRSFALF